MGRRANKDRAAMGARKTKRGGPHDKPRFVGESKALTETQRAGLMQRVLEHDITTLVEIPRTDEDWNFPEVPNTSAMTSFRTARTLLVGSELAIGRPRTSAENSLPTLSLLDTPGEIRIWAQAREWRKKTEAEMRDIPAVMGSVTHDGNSITVVTCREGAPVIGGVAELSRIADMFDGRYFFNRLLVRQEFRGKGIGTMLIKEAQKLAAQHGIFCVPSPYDAGKLPDLLRLYKRCGFELGEDGHLEWTPAP